MRAVDNNMARIRSSVLTSRFSNMAGVLIHCLIMIVPSVLNILIAIESAFLPWNHPLYLMTKVPVGDGTDIFRSFNCDSCLSIFIVINGVYLPVKLVGKGFSFSRKTEIENVKIANAMAKTPKMMKAGLINGFITVLKLHHHPLIKNCDADAPSRLYILRYRR